MTDYNKIAAYDIRKVMWEELVNSGIFDPNDYYPDGFSDPLIPIIPSQQVPEFNNLLPGKTYITYNVVQKRYGVQWWISTESFIMEIVCRDSAELQKISNFLMDIFRRFDITATEVNLQLDPESPFTFLWFNVESIDAVQPFLNEGGYMTGDMSIGYAYTRDVDSLNGRFA